MLVYVIDHYRYGSVKSDTALVVGDLGFFRTVELESLTLVTVTELGDIVETEHHVL